MLKPTIQELNLSHSLCIWAYAFANQKIVLNDVKAIPLENALRNILGQGSIIEYKNVKDQIGGELPSSEKQMENILQLLKKESKSLNRVRIRCYFYALEKGIDSLGIPESQRGSLYELEKETLELYTQSQGRQNLKMSAELSNLYSTIGQLAYVMVMADKVFMEEEREAFQSVIKENLGSFDWLAEDRFQVIKDLMVLDLESTYEHALFLIRKNREALDEELIQKFMNVMIKVAEVAGITPEEQALINRFHGDLYEIYESE